MFGIDIIDATFLTSVMISFVAGILSFLSPCVLPIVPPYLAYMSGISMNQLSLGKYRFLDTFLPALMFVIGLSTVFLIMGLVASSFGNFFLINQLIMNRISGIVVTTTSGSGRFSDHSASVRLSHAVRRPARLPPSTSATG